MRAPEPPGVVAALAAVAADDVAVEVDDAELVLELGDVHDLLARVDVELGRAAEAGPHVEVLAVRREDLDAVVLAVGDVDLALVLPDAVHGVEVARPVLGVAQALPRARPRPTT